MNDYEYGKEFNSYEKLIAYLNLIENLSDVNIIKADSLGRHWLLRFNKG